MSAKKLSARKRAGAGVLALAAALFMTGCASTPVPTDELAVSKTALQGAIDAGSSEYAPVELKTAQDKIAAAEKAIDDNENQRALYLAEEAEVDAKLAENKSLAAKAEKSLSESRDSQRDLQEEIQRQQIP